MMHINAKATPIIDTDYSYHITAVEQTNHMGSISHHITPLVINSLGGGHTNTHTQIRTHTDVRTETILRNQACAWFNNVIIILQATFYM